MSSSETIRLAAPYFGACASGAVTSRAQLVSDRDFERSAVYNEIIRPVNGFHALTAVQRAPGSAFFLSVCRPRHAKPFSQADATRLTTLMPHLAAALQFHRRFHVTERGFASLARVLDRLTTAVILVDGRGAPVFANAQALAIADQADGLIIDEAGVAGATPDDTRRLGKAVAEASADAAVLGRRLRLDRPSMRPALSLSLVPVWRLGIDVPGVRQARVAIFVTEPDAPAEIDQGAVADAFHLTARESEVATLLARGLSVVEIAAALGLRSTGVRQYLKRIFDKTGARSQAALVSLMRGFAQPHC